MSLRTFTLLTASIAVGYSHSPKDDSRFNVGWSSFLTDEPTEFHNLPLTWETDTPIPDYVVGSYIKNGPSQKSFGSENRWYNSYMDSWAKLNKITFSAEGDVHFSGRMIESRNFVRCRDANKIKPSITMAGVTPEDFSMEEMIEGGLHGFDNTNVLLWRLGSETNGTYIASTDYPLVNIIDPDNLGVLGQATPPLREGLTMTSSSHWIREVGTENSLNFGIIMNPLTLSQDFVLHRYGSTMEDHEEVARFPAPWLSMIHMISTSEHYAVIIFYPVKMNMISAPIHHMHILETLELVDSPTLIYLIDLRDGTVLEGFETDDPSMVYGTHIMNSWEESGDELVLDVSTNPWTALATFFDLEQMVNHPATDREDADSVMKRVRLNLKTRQTSVEDWPSLPGSPVWTNTVDFPVLNDKMYGYKNRYAYGWIGVDYWRQTLIKKDLEDLNNYSTWFKESHYPGEMYFISNPDGVEEDDGVLITLVFDGVREQSYVMLLDGQTFEEINISYLPHNVPFSFHGNWFPELH